MKRVAVKVIENTNKNTRNNKKLMFEGRRETFITITDENPLYTPKNETHFLFFLDPSLQLN